MKKIKEAVIEKENKIPQNNEEEREEKASVEKLRSTGRSGKLDGPRLDEESKNGSYKKKKSKIHWNNEEKRRKKGT